MTQPVPHKRTWKEIVANSDGALIFAPEKFIPMIKDWGEKRAKYFDLMLKAGRAELEMKVSLENMMLEFRKHLSEGGVGDNAFAADVGVEANALKEGEYIFTYAENKNV